MKRVPTDAEIRDGLTECGADDSDFAVARVKWWARVCRSNLDADALRVAGLLLSQADREEFEKTGALVVK